jgi:hypothetical protein
MKRAFTLFITSILFTAVFSYCSTVVLNEDFSMLGLKTMLIPLLPGQHR